MWPRESVFIHPEKILAAKRRPWPASKVALELGGDPNVVDQIGETALHGAAYRGANSIVHLLVEHGANTFDAENEAGWTPLTIAQGIFRTATFK